MADTDLAKLAAVSMNSLQQVGIAARTSPGQQPGRRAPALGPGATEGTLSPPPSLAASINTAPSEGKERISYTAPTFACRAGGPR